MRNKVKRHNSGARPLFVESNDVGRNRTGLMVLLGMMIVSGCGSGPEKQILGRWQEDTTEKIPILEKKIKEINPLSSFTWLLNQQRLEKELKKAKENPDVFEFLKDGTLIIDNERSVKYRFLDKERMEISGPGGSSIGVVKIEKNVLTFTDPKFPHAPDKYRKLN